MGRPDPQGAGFASDESGAQMRWMTPDGTVVHGFLTKRELIREDRRRIERICEHGVGHPIGATDKWEDWMGVHGCDGCCQKEGF